MKKYLIAIRDATDRMIFGDLPVDDWEKILEDAIVVYVGSAFLIGAGVDNPYSLSDAGQQSLYTLFNRYLGVVDDLASEARRGIDSSVNFKSRALLTTLGIKSSWLIGRELNECGVYSTEVNI